MSNEKETPLTDAESEVITDEFGAVWEAVTADFARDLERQLAEAESTIKCQCREMDRRRELLADSVSKRDVEREIMCVIARLWQTPNQAWIPDQIMQHLNKVFGTNMSWEAITPGTIKEDER